MFDPQAMSNFEETALRNKVFYLLKKYTSYTFLDQVKQGYQNFLNAFAAQLNDPGRVKPEPDSERWFKANLADGTYEADYRRFLKEMIPIEEGLRLLRTTTHKAESYRSILTNRFTDGLWGRGAQERSIDFDPFYLQLGIVRTNQSDGTESVTFDEAILQVATSKNSCDAARRSVFEFDWLLSDERRIAYHWTYESFFDSYSAFGCDWPPIDYPLFLASCPPHNSNPEGQIWSGEEIPVTGIWEPWFVEYPEKESLLTGLVGRLAGKPAIPEDPKFTGKVGCPNYFLAGATAFEYEMEGSDRKVKVAWRLIWEDIRYLDGTIPEEENNYLATASTAPPPTVLTAYPGDPCPEAGEWYSVNWNDQKVVLTQGQPMPGPKHSATGAVIWHRKR